MPRSPWAAAAVLFAALACQQAPPRAPEVAPPPPHPATRPFTPVADRRLENAHVVTAKVISGAQPEGDAAFAALRDLGIRTVISVDGAQPDVETAAKYGLRYVHLPITYSTVTPAQGRAIAKAIDDLPGPIYLHCHHGKHRSAAAVAVACVYNGSLDPGQAEAVLKTFGTGANYTGLWKSARDAQPLDPRELRDLDVRFVERAKIPKLAEAMVAIDGYWDHLKAIKAAGWRTPDADPDLDPPHEALQLEEHFREVARTDAAKARPDDFRRTLAESEAAAAALRRALASPPPDRTAAAEAPFKLLGASCTACHKAYRD